MTQSWERRVEMGGSGPMLSLTSEATETGTRAALSRIMRQLRADLAERLSPERAGMVEIAR